MSLRLAVLLCACLAPLGWALFWAVFHTVPGQDWVVFHTAAARVFAGDTAMLFDPVAFTAELNRSHAAFLSQKIALHPFVYPPATLLLALAFGWLPYIASLIAFLAVTGALLVAALWPWARSPAERAWLIAGVLAGPATAFTLGSGQLSFLIAACALGGMALLERRPFLAGLVFSALSLKPQFVPMIPVALLAGRHWRAIAGGVAGGAALVLASLAFTGGAVWISWLRFATGGDKQIGPMIYAVRIYDQSVHTCLRFLGAGEGLAGAGQLLAFSGAALAVAWVFARPFNPRTRVIVLLCALVFAAPHVGDYDLVLVAAAATFVLIEAHTSAQPVALACAAWLAPAFNPPALIAALHLSALTRVSALSVFLPAGLMLAAISSARAVTPQGRR